MIRARLLREGHPSIDGRLIESGATTWRSQVIPLMVMLGDEYDGHHGARLCGYVDLIAREVDGSGWLTGQLNTTLNVEGLCCEADMDQLQHTARGPWDDVVVFTAVRLMAVTLGTKPVWDDMQIGADE